MTDQLIDAGSSELAGTARHDNTRHRPPPLDLSPHFQARRRKPPPHSNEAILH
jgi:hypothetical protein